jgi:AraC-like DNA-binding protein
MDISEKSNKEIEVYLKRNLRRMSAVTIKGILADYSSKELHRHSVHQMLMIPRGISLLVDDSSSQGLFGVQCALIPSGVRHRSVVVGHQVSYQSLYIPTSLFQWEEHEVRVFSMSALCCELFKRLGTVPAISRNDTVHEKALELFLDIVREDSGKKKFTLKLPSPRTDAGRRIVEYMERNYMNEITLDDFKNVMPLSTRQISRIFSEDCGITLFDYLRAYRMMISSVHLGNGTKEILDTAYECGYRSVSSFYSDFKRMYGISPSRFRAMISGNLHDE